MPTAADAPYKLAQRAEPHRVRVFSSPAEIDVMKAARRRSGLSARQWAKRKKIVKREAKAVQQAQRTEVPR